MSIIITGLGMPTERENFNLTIKYNGIVLDTETGMQVAEAYELPPHGRLGDLDAVEAEIRRKTIEQFCVNIVHTAPTIIEADNLPVLHGTFAATSEQEALKKITPTKEGKT